MITENLTQTTEDLRLDLKFTFQQDNDPERPAKISISGSNNKKYTNWNGLNTFHHTHWKCSLKKVYINLKL